MIELRNITVHYGQTCVLQDVSVAAKAGEFIALVGPNGSGKSSLLKAIAGLLPHDGSTSLPQNSRARAQAISYLAQDSTAPNQRKVKDIIALGRTPFLGLLSKLTNADEAAVQRAAQSCEIEPLLERKYGSLSGGEKMRVHLGRAFATEAPILLADEPITALDPYYQISAMKILREAATAGTTVIAALHNLDYAKRFADRIWVMHGGKLVSVDRPEKALKTEILRRVFRITPNGETIA